MRGNIFKEKFLTLDIGQAGTSALYFYLGADRRLVIEKFDEQIDLQEFLSSPLRRAANASWEGKHFWNKRRRMLAVASASRATTIPLPLTWKREAMRATLPLMLDEIDDHIGRAMPKIIPPCRAEAAARFGVDPIEAVLVAMRATNVAVDGRRAGNVAGFIGSEISLVLDLTFVDRELFDQFSGLFKGPDGFFFMEAPQAELQALSLVRQLPLNIVIPQMTGTLSRASLFILEKAKEKYPVMYREPFLWSFEPIITALVGAFSVSRAVAGEMYEAYVRGRVSPDVGRSMHTIIRPHIEALEAAFRKAKIRGATFVPLPYDLPYEASEHVGKLVMERTSDALIQLLGKFDITLDPGPLTDRADLLFQHLAPFLLMYFDRAHGALDDRLRRKVHWLAG